MSSNSTQLASINIYCDDAIQSIQKLQLIKEIICNFESNQKVLVDQKISLEDQVFSLRNEKHILEQSIVEIKEKLKELGDELAETQDHVLNHVYTSNSSSNEDVSVNLDEHYQAESFHEDSQETFLETQGFVMETQEIEQYDRAGLPETPQQVQTPTQITLAPMQFQEIPAPTDRTSVMSVSTACSSKSHRRHSSSKWYKSPKKWRRMIRSNRLQSILIPLK